MEIVTSAHELGPHLWALLAQANWGRWSWFMLLGTSKNIKQLFKPNAFHQPMITRGKYILDKCSGRLLSTSSILLGRFYLFI